MADATEEHTPPRGGALIDPHEVLARLDRIDNRTLETHAKVERIERVADLVLTPRAPRSQAERSIFLAACIGVILIALGVGKLAFAAGW